MDVTRVQLIALMDQVGRMARAAGEGKSTTSFIHPHFQFNREGHTSDGHLCPELSRLGMMSQGAHMI